MVVMVMVMVMVSGDGDNFFAQWDTYFSEPSLRVFHVYVCSALLMKWEKDLLNMDFESMLMFLQKPPTSSWTEDDINMILSQAYVIDEGDELVAILVINHHSIM